MLAPKQVEEFRTRGYVTIRGMFTAADLVAVEAYLLEHQDVPWSHKNDDPLREAHYHYRPIYDLCTTPRLLDCIEALLGTDLVLLYSHLINKKTGGPRVAWHQDGPYWHRIDPKIAVTAWVALDDASPENGCMRVVPGTHLGRRDLGQCLSDVPDLLHDRPYELPRDAFDPALAEDLLMRRGDVSFHDSYLVHGSEPNPTGRRRAALTIRFVPTSTFIKDQPDRRQYLVRGRAVQNGNVYYQFGDVPQGNWTSK